MGDDSQYHPNTPQRQREMGYAITTDFYGMFGVAFSHFGMGC